MRILVWPALALQRILANRVEARALALRAIAGTPLVDCECITRRLFSRGFPPECVRAGTAPRRIAARDGGRLRRLVGNDPADGGENLLHRGLLTLCRLRHRPFPALSTRFERALPPTPAESEPRLFVRVERVWHDLLVKGNK